MLGLDGLAAQLARLVAGEEDHPPRPFGVALEHRSQYPGNRPGTIDDPRQKPDHSPEPRGRSRPGAKRPRGLRPARQARRPRASARGRSRARAPRCGSRPPPSARARGTSSRSELEQPLAGGASRGRRSARRPAAAAATPASARATATRCCSPPESVPGPVRRRARRARPRASRPRARRRGPRRAGARAISSGIATFSSAVNSGSRWWNWKTKPSVRLRNAQRSRSGEREHVLARRSRASPRRAGRACRARAAASTCPTPEAPDDRHQLPRRHVEVRRPGAPAPRRPGSGRP